MIAIDVKPYYQLCKAKGLLSIIDNTFLTPYLSTPLAEGADIVLHSATKYIGGHNDVLAGVVTVKDESLAQQLFDFHNMTGATLSPIDSYLLLRGLKTLHLRIERAQSNARKLAKKCQSLQAIDEVLYSGQTGMLSLRLNKAYSVAKLLENLDICIFAESLGGTETLVTFPYTQTHVDMPDAEKDKRGIDEYLIRLSLGVENYEDIERDIIQALDKAQIGRDCMTLSKETEVIFDWRRGVEYHSANPPLYDSSTFHQTSLGGDVKYDYARSGNPNRELLEEKLAPIRTGEIRFCFCIRYCCDFSSTFDFKSGDHVILPDDVYGGTFRLTEQILNGLILNLQP